MRPTTSRNRTGPSVRGGSSVLNAVQSILVRVIVECLTSADWTGSLRS